LTQTTNIPTPTTNEEYAIQALTIHGAFFERKCQEIVHQARGWAIHDTNYPVEYKGEASSLDIWAERKYDIPSRLHLPIECKKNNSEFVDWIFFPRATHWPSELYIQAIEIRPQPGLAGHWTIQQQLLRLKHDLIVADEARETKGNYLLIKQRQDRTKTSNTAITEAARQVAIASQSLMQQEAQTIRQISAYNEENRIKDVPSYYNLLCFPAIVTTANLYICEFQEADIDLATGEIPFDKAKLTPCSYLFFNYRVPVALQSPQTITSARHQDYREALNRASHMPILVVQSASFPTFLERLQLPTSHTPLFGNEVWYSLELEPNEA
jgi:hypothetical protein